MRILIDDITAEPKGLAFNESPDELNRRLAQGSEGTAFGAPLPTEVEYYRAGFDIVVEGKAEGRLSVPCGRCLAPGCVEVTAPFRVVIVPQAEATTGTTQLQADDLGVEFLRDDGVDVSAVVVEQVLLALPTTMVCRDDCAGLCSACGVNRNESTCKCEPEGVRPRMAVLHDLLRERRSQRAES